MDGKWLEDKKKAEIAWPKKVRDQSNYSARPGIQDVIDFTIEQLVRHFVIPEVPDVATVNPTGYAHHLNTLNELETILNAA